MKNAIAVLVLMLATACSCAGLQPRVEPIGNMLSSTVRVKVHVTGHQVAEHPVTGRSILGPEKEWGRTGTGVVYSKTTGAMAPVQSRVLTANHVVDAPGLGDIVDIPDEEGKMRVEAIEFSVRTAEGLTCKAQVLNTGDNNLGDVATLVAFCDAGHVAVVAESIPPIGQKIIITGHPGGAVPALITEGYVSGWTEDGYLQTSAPVYGGSSGGPVWYHGEVVGILVRVNTTFHHGSFVVPLHSVWERINETP